MPDLIFYPHEYAVGALHLSCKETSSDAPDLCVGDHVDHDSRNVELIGVSGWSEILLQFKIESQNRLIVPESGGPTARVFLLCASSDSRRRLAIQAQEEESGVWLASVPLKRPEWSGSLRIRPVAVGDDSLKVAGGAHWDVYLDRKDSMPGGFMLMEWKSFSKSPNPLISSRSDCAWYWELDEKDKPQLYLNEDIAHLKDVLNVVAHNGANAMLRNLTVRSILVPALVELVMHCLATLRGQALEEISGWRRDALVSIAGRARKASGKSVAEEWLNSADQQATYVQAEVMVGVQRHFNMNRTIEKSLHQLGRYDND